MTMNDKIRVLLADDHPLFLEGLVEVVNKEADLECIGVAQDGEEAVKMAEDLKPDVVVIDIVMPKINGIVAAKNIIETCPETYVVALSAYDYRYYVMACLRAKVHAYLLKTSPCSELVQGIRLVYSGNVLYKIGKNCDLLSSVPSDGRTNHTHLLQPREIEILRLCGRGLCNKSIAAQLSISENTVETHLANTYKKLSAQSRMEAVIHALREGWLGIHELLDESCN